MDKDEIERLMAETHAEEEEFRSMLPIDGFIGKYMRYTDRQESPGSYHFWVAVSIIGAVMQRRVWISKGIYQVYPNLYTILIGPSGKCRKTRAMMLGLELLSGFDWANVMADKTTPEALLEALRVGTSMFEKTDQSVGKTINVNPNPDHYGIVTAYELAVFVSKQNYNSGMVALLTTLYDCPPSFKYLTRNKRPIVLNNPGVSLIGASTPEWLATNLPADSFEGGFMSRIVFVVRHRRDRNISLPEHPAPLEREDLRAIIQDIHKLSGEITMSQEAKKWYDDWYTSVESVPVTDTALLGFVERKPDTILKVAMVLAVSQKRGQVTAHDLRQAHAVITWTQERMFSAFAHIELSPLGILQRKIMEMLDNTGRVTRGEVLRKLGGRLQRGLADLEQVQQILVESGQMEVQIIHTKKAGRPSILYVKKDIKT